LGKVAARVYRLFKTGTIWWVPGFCAHFVSHATQN